jgi:DNA-binding transcriptional ArsR family regulator
MIYLLRAKEMTVSQIAEELHLTPQAIYHQIRKLKDTGMVEVAREERVDHFIETYYRASAEVFHMAHGAGESKEYVGSQVKEALSGLSKLGMGVKTDPDTVSKIVQTVKEMKDPMTKSVWSEKAAGLEDVDFFARQTVFEYANLLSMSDKEFEEFLDCYRVLRKLLRSSLKDPSESEVSD